MDRIQCPYCGEEIASTAKKCRYCGEWLTEAQPQVAEYPQQAELMPVEAVEVNSAAESGNFPTVNPNYPIEGVQAQPIQPLQQPNVIPGVQPGQNVQSIGGQPIVINVVNQNTVEQNVEQTQSVEQTVIVSGGGRGSSSEAPGWIFTEMWVIAAGMGLALKSWWWFLGIGVIGSIMLLIPYIGAVMCVIIGAGWGLLAGAIGSLISTSAGWVIGLLVGAGAIYGHLEARKANMDELDEDD